MIVTHADMEWLSLIVGFSFVFGYFGYELGLRIGRRTAV